VKKRRLAETGNKNQQSHFTVNRRSNSQKKGGTGDSGSRRTIGWRRTVKCGEEILGVGKFTCPANWEPFKRKGPVKSTVAFQGKEGVGHSPKVVVELRGFGEGTVEKVSTNR